MDEAYFSDYEIENAIPLIRAPRLIRTMGFVDQERGITGRRNVRFEPRSSPSPPPCYRRESIIRELLKPSPTDTSDETMDWDDIDLSYFGMPENSCDNNTASEHYEPATISRLPRGNYHQRSYPEASGSSRINSMQNERRSRPRRRYSSSEPEEGDAAGDTDGQAEDVSDENQIASGTNLILPAPYSLRNKIRIPVLVSSTAAPARLSTPRTNGENQDTGNDEVDPDVAVLQVLPARSVSRRRVLDDIDLVDEDEL